ncbi:malate dehydrogenase [Elysia marginata]|uniref:Malate dehydrogenase n=1 Tax=Elysia marginata TaxID=1093978 RepID=A0AAV4GGG3_9GAST|nr:malate dehydrogenase [Elysia marginata]
MVVVLEVVVVAVVVVAVVVVLVVLVFYRTVVALEEMHQFVVRCMEAVGTKREHASALADLLVAADYRGHFSHGLNRLDMYVQDMKMGICRCDKEPEIIKETAATALVEGNNLLGPVVGKFCTDLAIKKAKESGVGWVSARGSNHFGIAGWYAMRAMEHGMMGLAFTNTSPLMVPTRATQTSLGTNPIACAAPANNGDSFVLDMATTAVALGKLELNDRKGLDIPIGWGCDDKGKPTTKPAQAKGLMPLGGTEECSGYKGYGLAMMVEIFCGIMAGADFGRNIRSWKTTDREANLGQCFIVVDTSAFAPGFSDRLTDLSSSLRGLEPSEGQEKVFIPGDPERQHMDKCDKLGGIEYHPNQIDFANNLAKKLNIEPMQTKEEDTKS